MASVALLAGGCVIEDHPYEATPLGRIVAIPGILEIAEAQEKTFTVRLDMPPAGVTTVECVSADTDGLSPFPPVLQFSAESASVDQTVTVTAFQDWDLFDSSSTVICSSGDLEHAVVNVNTVDDDEQKILATPDGTPPINIIEGQSLNVQVRLQFDPGLSSVVTALRVGTEVMVTPSSLVFTSDNYSTPQNVLIQGLADADTTDDADTVTLSSSGAAQVSLGIVVTDVD